MFTSCFKALYIFVCVCEYSLCDAYSIPHQRSWGFGGDTNNVDCQLLHTHTHAHTHQMRIWCVCDVANDSSVAAV